MPKKLHKLNYYNRVIRHGRIKSSLITSLGLLLGLGLGKAFTGNFIVWALFSAWLSFLVIFVIWYFIWPRNITKAQKIIDEIGEGELASPPKSNTISLIITLIVFAILIAPITLRSQLAQSLIRQQQEATVEVKAVSEDGSTVKFNIPQLYIISQHNPRMKRTFFEKDVGNITLVATLNDMKPLPVATARYSSTERYKQTPSQDHDIIMLLIKGQVANINETSINVIKSEALKKYPHLKPAPEKYGLNVLSGEVTIKSTFNGYNDTKTGVIELSTATDTAYENMFMLCQNYGICVLTTNIPPLGLVSITFHTNHYDNWKDVYNKSHALIKSFIVPKQ